MRRFSIVRLIYPLALSLAALGLLLGLVGKGSAEVSPAGLIRALKSAVPILVITYGAAQLLQAALRAWRAWLLLRHGAPGERVPGLGHVFWVSLARNMFVDMLPARIGELSYIGMLNRGYKVGADVCLASLSIGLLFDFMALLLVLALAIPAASQGATLTGSLIVLIFVCVAGALILFRILPASIGWARKTLPDRLLRRKAVSGTLRLAESTASSISFVRSARIVPSVLTLSAGIRIVKYAGLYCLFLAVTRPLWPDLSRASVWAVLVALIAAEGAASLPVPTFMSFGTYEAGGFAALCVLGFAPADSIMTMFTLHVISQACDYTLGALAYTVFSLRAPALERKKTDGARVGTRSLLATAVPLMILLLAIIFLGLRYRSFRNLGTLVPPAAGLAVHESSSSVTEVSIPEFEGKIVWSSNRGGQHDLWMLNFPGATLQRLTKHSHTETYPRFSPDGRSVVFCRSQEPWISQRNPVPWDTFVLDLETGQEMLVATNAFTPAWTRDGSQIVFVRDGGQLMQVSWPQLSGKARREQLLLESAPPGKQVFQTPDPGPDGKIALTVRGHKRGVTVLEADGTLQRLGSGCQLTWIPGAEEMLCVDSGKPGGNAIYVQRLVPGLRELFFDAANEYSHEYFPRLSADRQWLVYGASTGGHEHDTADYEIFLWKTTTPMDSAIRLTFHTGNDCWPDIWVPR